jgi:predicted transcriptional regulator of viral defense system
MVMRSRKMGILLRCGHSFTVLEAARLGVPRSLLSYHCRQGHLRRLCSGVYESVDAEGFPYPVLEQLVKKGVDFVVCLLSALQIHGFTTQLPTEFWVAMPQGGTFPRLNSSPVSCVHLTESVYRSGVELKVLNGLEFKIYSPAKTVADCFKFRNKIGMDVALEALRDGYRRKLFTIPELLQEARVCRVERILSPYIESLLP